MHKTNHLSGIRHTALGLIAMAAFHASAGQAGAKANQAVKGNTPKLVNFAKNMGPVSASQPMTVSIWLKPHNQTDLDSLARDVYNPNSSRYQEWLNHGDWESTYAPTAQDVGAIQNWTAGHGLAVTLVGPDNMFVRAQGSAAAVGKAFQTTINNYQVNGKTYFANATDPVVDASIAPLVQGIHGLHNVTYEHHNKQQMARSIQSVYGYSPLASAAAPAYFSSVCFNTTGTQSYTASGGYPQASYSGTIYAANGGSYGCGYTPAEIQRAYGLDKLYKQGLDGTGQTVVIIDWCGSPTISSDANAFSTFFNLPPLNNNNFKILYSDGQPTCAAPDPEINIDVEWAHAIAPGANIDLVVPLNATFEETDTGLLYSIIHQLGGVISNSYGAPESLVDVNDLNIQNELNELAAVMGISANYSSGDDGDFTDLGVAATVSAPADSPFATAIGGISLALNSNGSISWQAGWGNNQTLLVDEGTIIDPPTQAGNQYFYAGSGGGISGFYPAAPWQIPNSPARELPDISWLADPYTGGIITISYPGQFPEQVQQVYGGTSLACPMFSALWAIAAQAAGSKLGLAAAYLPLLPANAVTDIVPVSSPHNVTGSIQESKTVTDQYSASDLAQPLENTTVFVSTIWNYPLYQYTPILLTFGTDTSLTVTPGWDDVTGVGVPNPQAFAGFFNLGKKATP